MAFDLQGIKSFTRFWALLMFGSYSVINIIVLLNMLIAMMSNSYQIISERSDTEWKFARSGLWIRFEMRCRVFAKEALQDIDDLDYLWKKKKVESINFVGALLY